MSDSKNEGPITMPLPTVAATAETAGETVLTAVASGAGTQAVENAATAAVVQIAETAVEHASPIAGEAIAVLGPDVVGPLVNGLVTLFSHIGAEIPAEISALQAWFAKL